MKAASEKRNFHFAGYLLCALCFGMTVWSFFPGLMTADSIASLDSGRSGVYSDLNTPLMSLLWGELDQIIAGPALMLILQNLVFWSGCAIFWRATYKKSFRLGLCLILFGLIPSVLSQLTTVWKDVGMGATLFAASALIFLAGKSKNKVVLFVSSLFLFYGYAARLNALPAVLPLAIWSGFVTCRIFEIKKTKLLPVLCGGIYFLTLSLTVYFVNGKITDWQTVYPSQQIYLYDLAAVSKDKNEALFPQYILNDENFSLEKVESRYNERSVSELIFAGLPEKDDVPVLKWTTDPAEIAALRQKWFETVTANPRSYLAHRWRVFAQLTGMTRSVIKSFCDLDASCRPDEFRGEDTFGGKVLSKYFNTFRRPFPQTFFFRAVIWLLFCFYFAFQSVKRRLQGDWEIVFVLSTSCLLFTFAYFPTAPSTEFRYLFWSAISSAAAAIFGIYLLRQESDGKTDGNFLSKFLARFSK